MILRISYKDHVTNEVLCAKIQKANGRHKNLLTVVKRCKLQWYGHVSPSSGLAKNCERGEEDKADRGKRWEDNIREWTGLEFAQS